MKIFEELFFGNISECSRKRNYREILKHNEEYEIFNKIIDKLPEEDKHLMEDFIEKWESNFDDDLMQTYIQGVKTGLLLGVEAGNIDI